MKFKSEIVTQASGSIGGATYSRARGGVLYRRSRAIPVNPQTNRQSHVRNAMTELNQRWVETLSEVQREAWRTYASNVTVVNKLGDQVNNSGQNWYLGCNIPRLQASAVGFDAGGVIDDAPTIFDRGPTGDPTINSVVLGSPVLVGFNDADFPLPPPDNGLLVYQGQPRNQSRKFFGGPWRLVAVTEESGGGGIEQPLSIPIANFSTYGFPLVEGQVVDFKIVGFQGDGRLTSPVYLRGYVIEPEP